MSSKANTPPFAEQEPIQKEVQPSTQVQNSAHDHS